MLIVILTYLLQISSVMHYSMSVYDALFCVCSLCTLVLYNLQSTPQIHAP
jgi:ABC-type transport system involved in Fe-S cluster assembly fused permease/ATPase subunit